MCILCDPGKPQFHSTSRRNFLKGTAATGLAAGAMALFRPRAEAQGQGVKWIDPEDYIKVLQQVKSANVKS